MGRWAVLVILLGAAGCDLLAPTPGIDRADPRFADCLGGVNAKVEAAFPLIASEYRAHFPFATFGPDMEADTPAFAVVFAQGENPVDSRGPGPLVGPVGVGRVVCMYVGKPPRRHIIFYPNINVAGMRE